MQVVALAVVDRDPVAVDLGHAVGRAGVERRALASAAPRATLPNISLDAGLVEADLRVDDADGVEQAGDAEGGDLAGEHRLAERRLHERLGGEVVDLVGPVLAQDVDQRDLVEQVAGHERRCRSCRWAMRSKLTVLTAPHHADHLVALVEQQLGEVGAVLAGDAGDERTLGHGVRFYRAWSGVC